MNRSETCRCLVSNTRCAVSGSEVFGKALPNGGSGIEELLIGMVDEQDSRLVTPERAAGLLVECCKIAARKRGGRR